MCVSVSVRVCGVCACMCECACVYLNIAGSCSMFLSYIVLRARQVNKVTMCQLSTNYV